MTTDHVELHLYRPLDRLPSATHRAAAASLIQSCLAKPYKVHRGEAWHSEPQYRPRPHTVWYETAARPPLAVLPVLHSAGGPVSPSNARHLPEFQHWRPRQPRASGPGTDRPLGVSLDIPDADDPSSVRAAAAEEEEEEDVTTASKGQTRDPLQSIVRKRPATVAGAWATEFRPRPEDRDSHQPDDCYKTRCRAPRSVSPASTAATLAGPGPAPVRRGGTGTASSGPELAPLLRLRTKKMVRIESPRTSDAREKAAAAGPAPALLLQTSPAERPGSHLPSSSSRSLGQTSARQAGLVLPTRDRIVPVPRRTANRTAAAETVVPVAYPSRAIGAIQRCIPPPYAHRVLDPLLHPATDTYDLNPSRQEPAAVLHSFVDPAAYERPVPGAGAKRASSSLPFSSPVTMEFLAPGRRGAWLIPLSAGEGPVPGFTSKVVWPDTLTPLCRPDKDKRALVSKATRAPSPPPPLEWTDARLAVLWSYLTGLHEGRRFGHLRAQAIAGPGNGRGGDLIKVNCDAHLALAIRGLLDLLSVKAVAKRRGEDESLKALLARKGGGEKEENDGDDDNDDDDDERWFKGRALVWIDEQSRAILTA
ncbi:hypothetical protein JCM3774_005674 [Rhodotorula dairenensis]